MSVAATYGVTVTVVETLEATPTGAGQSIQHGTYNSNATLNATSNPPGTKVGGGLATLVAGAKTIDLTAVPSLEGVIRDMTGLKVQIFKFKNKATNLSPMTVNFGATNAYLLGGAAWSFILQPGMEITVFGNDLTPDVGGATKNIDIAGTGVEAGEYIVVCG